MLIVAFLLPRPRWLRSHMPSVGWEEALGKWAGVWSLHAWKERGWSVARLMSEPRASGLRISAALRTGHVPHDKADIAVQ